jgi:SAM-dependent methyltransferase
MTTPYNSFYSERRDETYGKEMTTLKAEDHPAYNTLKIFIETYSLKEKKCLEIGSSGGGFQDMVIDYYGTDISKELAQYYHKPYKVAEGHSYPFENESFDAIWTIYVYEHIPHIQKALKEIERLLKPGGVVLFLPAWQCRVWAADGYPVRPFSDFGLKGKLVKLSIPIRNSIIWRSLYIFPKRLYRHLKFIFGYRYKNLMYKKIFPNYTTFYMSDSDACNHIDPHDAILWFESNNFRCLSNPMHVRAFLVRTGALVFKKKC